MQGLLRALPSATTAIVAVLELGQLIAACGFAITLASALTGLVLEHTLHQPDVLAATGFAAARGLFIWLGRAWCDRLAAERLRTARDRLTETVLDLGAIALSRTKASDLAALDAELFRLLPLYNGYLPAVVRTVAASLLIPPVVLWLDLTTGLLVVLTLPLTVLFLALVGSATAEAVARQWTSHLRLGSRLVDITRNLGVIDGHGATAVYRKVFDDSAQQHARVTTKVLRSAFMNAFVLEVAAILSTALAAVWIGARLVGGTAALAPTMAALILLGEVFTPLRTLGAQRHAAMDAVPVLEQLHRLTQLQEIRRGSRPLPRVRCLELRDCCAELGPSSTGLALATGRLEVGAPSVLRGPSGSGKSTLLLAIAGHADYRGELVVDGIARQELDLAEWRSVVAYLPQRPRIVPGSLADNVRLNRPDADVHQVDEALRKVGLDEVAAGLPSGSQTRIGDGGVRLSGGEIARLALARVLLGDARVVLLDEVTAHLDEATAASLTVVIENCLSDRIVLLATHLDTPDWSELRLSVRPPVQVAR